MCIDELINELFNFQNIKERCLQLNQNDKAVIYNHYLSTALVVKGTLLKFKKRILSLKNISVLDRPVQELNTIAEYSHDDYFREISTYYSLGDYEYDTDSFIEELPSILSMIDCFKSDVEIALFPLQELEKVTQTLINCESKKNNEPSKYGSVKICYQDMIIRIGEELSLRENMTINAKQKTKIIEFIQLYYPDVKYESLRKHLQRNGYSKERQRNY